MSIVNLEKDEKDIIERFYNRLRETLIKAYCYEDSVADFEVYRWILQNTSKSPRDYFKIFNYIPKEYQMKIVKHLGYKTPIEFKKNFIDGGRTGKRQIWTY